MRGLSRLFCLVVLAFAWGAASAEAQMLRSRGTVDQVDGDTLGIKTLDGYRTFYKLAPYSLVTALRRVAPGELRKDQQIRIAVGEELGPGLFAAAAAQAFPANDPTIGTSQFLWDMTPLGSVVDGTFDRLVDLPGRPEQAASSVGGANGKSPPVMGAAALILISGRPVIVVFPPGCPIGTLVVADRTLLKVGTPLFVYGRMTGDHPIEVALADPGNLAPKKSQ